MTESVNEDFQKRLRDFLEVRWIVSSISSEEGRLDLSFCIFNISGGVLRSTCVKICEETYSVVPDNKSAAFVKEALEIADSSLNGELVIYCRSCSRDMVASAMEHFVSTFHTFPRKYVIMVLEDLVYKLETFCQNVVVHSDVCESTKESRPSDKEDDARCIADKFLSLIAYPAVLKDGANKNARILLDVVVENVNLHDVHFKLSVPSYVPERTLLKRDEECVGLYLRAYHGTKIGVKEDSTKQSTLDDDDDDDDDDDGSDILLEMP